MLTEATLREFYEHVYPVELVTQWLGYNFGSGARASGDFISAGFADSEDGAAVRTERNAAAAASTAASDGYLARREFCFTLLGDIFTRFRSYSSATELRAELVKSFPEKIDVGAVYNVRPSQKQGGVGSVLPLERELVFDIDMSDYDNVRSCCSGKSICKYCWAWMSCAVSVLRTVLEEDFGFKYLLPVFSGRRGVHLWVCDKSARIMHDDQRAGVVGYLTVVAPKTLRSSIVNELTNHRPIHPTIRHVLDTHIDESFTRLFVTSDSANPNNVETSPAAAKIVYDAITTALKMGRRDQLNRFMQHFEYTDGNVLDWRALYSALGPAQEAKDIVNAAQLLIMYPRLDEHVTTRRDHLLKLPFCVHPGTGSLCCPLEWEQVPNFDPIGGAPKLGALLLDRSIAQWEGPLVNMLRRMSADVEEQ